MYVYELESAGGRIQEYLLLTVFAVGGTSYAALIPGLDGEPLKADVVIYACEGAFDNLDFYEIDDEDEYAMAADAFRQVVAAL